MMATTRRERKRPSLHARVVTSVLAFCLLLVGLDGWRTWQLREITIGADRTETTNLARSLAQHAHDTVQTADAILVGVRERVESEGLAPDKVARLDRLMRYRVSTLPALHGLFVIDAAGRRIASALPPVFAATSYGDRAYFQWHRSHADRDAHLGSPVRSKTDGSWIITVSRRVDDRDGRFAGIVLGTIAVDYLQRFYGTFDVGRQGVIALDGGDGIVIARAGAGRGGSATGASVAGGPVFRRLLPRADAGIFRTVSPIDGVVRLGSYRRVEGYPLVIIVAHSLEEVLADWRSDGWLHLVISAGAALALGVVGWRFAGEIRTRQRATRRYHLLAENSSDAIVCVGLDGRQSYVSPSFTRLTGWSVAEAMEYELQALIHPDDREELLAVGARLRAGAVQATGRLRHLRKDGSYVWVEICIRMIERLGADGMQFVANMRDITERKIAEDQIMALNRELAVLATTDGLTGLANRRRFDEALGQEWDRAARDRKPLSLLMIDVDRFKLYNDRYGHQRGDQCLHAVAAAIGELVRRPGDLAARYGGEEITLLLPGTSAAGAVELAARACGAIEASAIAHEANMPGRVATVSIGVATMFPALTEQASGARALIAAADAALYEAKRSGRNRVVTASAAVPEEQAGGLAHASAKKMADRGAGPTCADAA